MLRNTWFEVFESKLAKLQGWTVTTRLASKVACHGELELQNEGVACHQLASRARKLATASKATRLHCGAYPVLTTPRSCILIYHESLSDPIVINYAYIIVLIIHT
jgi:hypothetical protein